MANRFKPEWDSAWEGRAIIGGCIFCCAALLMAGGAEGAAIACQMFGEGDHVTASSSWTWEAGTIDLAPEIPDVTCGGEYLSGVYTSKMQGTQYQAERLIDNEVIMNFTTKSAAEGLTFGREGLMLFETGGSGQQAMIVCGNTALANETAYNQAAAFQSKIMGESVSYKSQGATIQVDDTLLDQMAIQALASGDGAVSMRSWSQNQVGIGNTTAIGYQSETSDRIRASGPAMQAGMTFQWTSFSRMWEVSPPTNASQEA
jgi:hypothetical protein